MKTWKTPSVTVCTAAELQETIQAKAWSSTISLFTFMHFCKVGDAEHVTYGLEEFLCICESKTSIPKTVTVWRCDTHQTSTWTWIVLVGWVRIADWS